MVVERQFSPCSSQNDFNMIKKSKTMTYTRYSISFDLL